MEKRSQRRVKWWMLRPCFCDLTPHYFVICDRRDRGSRLCALYCTTCVQAWEKEERRCIFLFLQSINQGASVPSFWLWQHRPQWFPRCQKLFSHLGTHCGCPWPYHLVLLLCAIYTNLNYIDLKNYRIKISKKEVILPRGWRGRFLIWAMLHPRNGLHKVTNWCDVVLFDWIKGED